MTIPEAVTRVRYLTDADGERTHVLVPLSTWTALLDSWRQMILKLEDEEDAALLKEWLTERARGEAEGISLDQLEDELIADGLLPG
jgi:hypothetical protein